MARLKTSYTDLREINDLQENIMRFIGQYARTIKKPTPQKEIIKAMKEQGIKDFTALFAINSLLKKGFIRRAIPNSNTSSYVQLRSVKI